AAPPPPPPAPTAPPIPYEYLGKLADGHSVRIFLVRGDRPYTVTEGDVLDGSYKVKSITDTTMTFVYLPLNMIQTLPVGSKP
ncbi:secretion system X translation initiation factor, partial [Aromatoleum toluolicum]|nr:secretion system X translation initiation factor [Aromatoleum toluolicum]